MFKSSEGIDHPCCVWCLEVEVDCFVTALRNFTHVRFIALGHDTAGDTQSQIGRWHEAVGKNRETVARELSSIVRQGGVSSAVGCLVRRSECIVMLMGPKSVRISPTGFPTASDVCYVCRVKY